MSYQKKSLVLLNTGLLIFRLCPTFLSHIVCYTFYSCTGYRSMLQLRVSTVGFSAYQRYLSIFNQLAVIPFSASRNSKANEAVF